MCILYAAASAGHRCGIDHIDGGCRECDTVAEPELHGLFSTDSTRLDPTISQPLSYPLVRAFVLLPCIYLRPTQRAERELFSRPVFLECGAYHKSVTLDGDHDGEESLTATPADVREVDH